MKTYAVILAGGRGERFWPQSRRNMPKQFLQLFGDQSLLELTSRRIAPICPLERQRFVIDYTLGRILGRVWRPEARRTFKKRGSAEALRRHNFIYEPYGRNTAPALALAAAYLAREDPDSTLVVLPADHLIENVKAFRQSVCRAVALAQQDYLVTFGIPPARPDTNYGYIEIGEPLATGSPTDVGEESFPRLSRMGIRSHTDAFSVRRFREKPDLPQAREFLRKGGFWWNSGMFVWRSDVFLHAVELFMPEFYEQLMQFQCRIGTRGEKTALAELYAGAPSVSVDYAIMEHARNVAVVRAGFDWDDVGSWSALERHFQCDEAGNVALGPLITLDARNCMSLTDRGIVAMIGCENLVVVRTPDAVLVCPKERAGDIKKLLARMREDKRLGLYL